MIIYANLRYILLLIYNFFIIFYFITTYGTFDFVSIFNNMFCMLFNVFF